MGISIKEMVKKREIQIERICEMVLTLMNKDLIMWVFNQLSADHPIKSLELCTIKNWKQSKKNSNLLKKGKGTSIEEQMDRIVDEAHELIDNPKGDPLYLCSFFEAFDFDIEFALQYDH